MKIKIKGDAWEVRVLSPKEMEEIYSDSVGMTEDDKRLITFSSDHTDLWTIKHELWHAFSSYTRQEGTAAGFDHYDEVFANQFGYDAEEILKLARRIHRKLNTGKGEKE